MIFNGIADCIFPFCNPDHPVDNIAWGWLSASRVMFSCGLVHGCDR